MTKPSTYRNKNFKWLYPIIDQFAKVNSGILLISAAAIAMLVANLPATREWYATIWETKFFLGIDKGFNVFNYHGEPLTLHQFVNDALMAVFFFLVGLEIKREMMVGELASVKQALLPFFAACGGMILPVAIFLLTAHFSGLDAIALKGSAIPMATDIAFSLGVLSLLGKRVPLPLKIFLTSLAVVDDIGGIVVIAIFYSGISKASAIYLGLATLLFVALFIANKLDVRHRSVYMIAGACIWYFFLQAGIHPTIAGVLVAFTVPARPRINLSKYIDDTKRGLAVIGSTLRYHSSNRKEEYILSNTQIGQLTHIKHASDSIISPLQEMEDVLHTPVNYMIMPLFAFANAGIVFDGMGLHSISGVALCIILGLVVGKTLGIFTFSWLALKLGIAKKPTGMTWSNLLGIALVGGVGFTVALFIAGLSYPLGSEILNQAKFGVIFGSLIAGVGGYLYLKFTCKEQNNDSNDKH